MPTVLLVDVSLSMCRPVIMPESTEPYQLRNLAVHGINSFLDYLNTNCKLEFTSLVIFSSLWEVVVQFTRDVESLKAALLKLECYDKTCIETGLEGVKNVVLEEWGASVTCQVVLVTDGSSGIGQMSLKSSLQRHAKDSSSFPLPYPFPCKLHVVCVNNPTDNSLQSSSPLFQKLVDINGGGQVFVPDGPLSFKTVQQMFQKVSETFYKPYHGMLRCGNLMSHVALSPPPEGCTRIHDFQWRKAELTPEINICGFLDISDACSPPALSRHLVLPIPTPKEDGKVASIKQEVDASDDDSASGDEGKQPSFCVLLHGSLKVEGMVAICDLGGDWYGMLYSWADSKKKSNLMLSTFEPGLDIIPWLGNLSHLGLSSLPPVHVLGADETLTFPVKPSEKRSYAQSCVVWIKQSGLQADIQKILRHARKLPEKTQNFYKELNKLRKAALSFGFYELLDGMATILDRECTLLPGTAHPDAALQLTHAATALRSPSSKDYSTQILPLRTKFGSDD